MEYMRAGVEVLELWQLSGAVVEQVEINVPSVVEACKKESLVVNVDVGFLVETSVLPSFMFNHLKSLRSNIGELTLTWRISKLESTPATNVVSYSFYLRDSLAFTTQHIHSTPPNSTSSTPTRIIPTRSRGNHGAD